MKSPKQAAVKRLDTVFKKWIRLRDCPDGWGVCCSCGKRMAFEDSDGGHFINCRWMPTRWREDNVHAQCRSCNRFDEGNAVGYALFMIEKYGKAHVEYLRGLKSEPALFTLSEIELMIADYRKRLNCPSFCS